MKKIIPATLLVVFMTGCAPTHQILRTGSTTLTAENIAKIHKGMSKDEVAQTLGAPFSRTQSTGFGEIWSYSGTETMIENPPILSFSITPKTSMVVKTLAVTFDETGTLSNVTTSYMNPAAMNQYTVENA